MSMAGSSDWFPAALRVLVVDDDRTSVYLLESMLKRCLYEVKKCCSGEAALSLLRENQDGYDIIISEIHLPDMDGYHLIECVSFETGLPVIMMSADASKADIIKGMLHGASEFLFKPVRMDELGRICRDAIRKKEMHELKELETWSSQKVMGK